MGFSYTSIRHDQVKQCRSCNADITFVKNRNDKWFAVDTYFDRRFDSYVYRHSGGAYNNLTPWHKCKPQRDFEAENLVRQANLCITKLCQAYLLKRRESGQFIPQDDPRWQSVFERANNRAIRRVALLPPASKAHLGIQ